jgi:hypothetical protein
VTARLIGPVIGVCVTAAVASAHSAPVAAAPHLMSLTYVTLPADGAATSSLAGTGAATSSSPGLRLRAREPQGQVVEVAFQEIRRGIANGVGGAFGERCQSHGRPNGAVEVSDIPLGQALSRGIHEIRVVAYGSRCATGIPETTAVRTFTIQVRH